MSSDGAGNHKIFYDHDLSLLWLYFVYGYRWTIELFFHWLRCVCWLNCILGARQLLSHKEYGVALQMYADLIVSLSAPARNRRSELSRRSSSTCPVGSATTSSTRIWGT